MDATTMRASLVSRSMPTRDTRTQASITMPLSSTRSRTSMRLLPQAARSLAIPAHFREYLPHFTLEILRQARLRQEYRRAGVERALLGRRVRVASEHDERDSACARVMFQSVDGADAIETWHREVHHDHVGPQGEGDLDRGLTILGSQDVEAAVR